MREIKYRGLNEETGEWEVGYLLPRSLLDDPDYLAPLWIASGFENECTAVDKDTVGQFTGFHDKNGKDIYEGDIIKNCAGNSNKIIWHNGAFIIGEPDDEPDEIGDYYIHLGECSVDQFEVIGNIHENPELLEGRE